METAFQQPIVILANGRFPTHPIPLSILDKAGTVICTDGSADTLIELDRTPHVIIGDLDSIKLKNDEFKGLWIPAPDQNKTDLQKTLEWCLINGLKNVVVLGTMGKREDHSLGNLYILAEFSQKMDVHFVADYSCIYCFKGMQSFKSTNGQLISIVAIKPVKSISTKGLKYPLIQEPLLPECNGISNEAEGEEFMIDTSEPIWLFINHMNGL
ncbi:MAG TPA: thiamine diphosphokinase [Candidatus Marinimicrobia bacterium]|nr:thiamine diphosphokinase [Candidatus Neomarinimicrobiota bacterium]